MFSDSGVVSSPVLSCDEVREYEAQLFAGDERREWAAMLVAGESIARALLRDFKEVSGEVPPGRLLVLVGKGHNGGDALIAAEGVLRATPAARVDVMFVFGERTLRPLAQKAWVALQHAAGSRVECVHRALDLRGDYCICIDGVFGFQFRPPLPPRIAEIIAHVNGLAISLRASVDLPSGLSDRDAFRADFTYATGVAKAPLFTSNHAGRLRLIDLGWSFPPPTDISKERILSEKSLDPLRQLRSSRSDKRSFGHLAVIGGSRNFPGAVLMTVKAALHSGVGLLTAFVPDSLVASFAAAVPEAMWVGWPETAEGGLAMEGVHLLQQRLQRATALVVGPGLGRERETRAWLAEELKSVKIPMVLDADALQPEIVQAGTSDRILTPHAGEFERISGGADLASFARNSRATVILKGPITRLSDGVGTYSSFFGGPVLARGGSGDLLAGLVGGLLAQSPTNAFAAAARGVIWHGRAADELARARGAVAVTTTQLLDYLPSALGR